MTVMKIYIKYIKYIYENEKEKYKHNGVCQ